MNFDFIRNHKTVGIMGGHSLTRDDDDFALIAETAWRLTQAGYFISTGGGPGAMEAGNLGAYLSGQPIEDLMKAIELLKTAPTYRSPGWFDTALEVLDRHPDGAESLGVPTWFYGHEPSNLFASHIAKYFANSVREDGLLAISQGGIIYAKGAAGTVQEIFQDACQNHYVTCDVVSPMVFLGSQYWTQTLPVLPLIKALAGDRLYADYIGVADSVEHILEFITAHPPTKA